MALLDKVSECRRAESIAPNASVTQPPKIPDILTEIDWRQILVDVDEETKLMLSASNSKLSEAFMHLRLLLSMQQGVTLVKENAPVPLWLFKSEERFSSYKGVGTSNKEVAIYTILVHIATLYFNNSAREDGFGTKKFAQTAAKIIRILNIASSYRTVHLEKEMTPPAVLCNLDALCRLATQITFVCIFSTPDLTTPTATLLMLLQRLDGVRQLCDRLDASRYPIASVRKWMELVKEWYLRLCSLVMAYYVIRTNEIPGDDTVNSQIATGVYPNGAYINVIHLLETTYQKNTPAYAFALEQSKELDNLRTLNPIPRPTLQRIVFNGSFYQKDPFKGSIMFTETKIPSASERSTMLMEILPEALHVEPSVHTDLLHSPPSLEQSVLHGVL